jgi:alkylation response protein AidB-like acyl-CoA dehydrogenase
VDFDLPADVEQLHEGTSEIQREIIAKVLLRE